MDLARYRGYSNLFCFWLRANALIGMHNNQICFPIHENGIVKRVHVKMNDRKGWYYYPSKGPKIAPLIIGKGNIYHVFESQWDMLAVMDQNQYHEKQEDVYIATRGAF